MEEKRKQLWDILESDIPLSDKMHKICVLFDVSNSVCKCPLCGEEMKGIELTHYKCKKCNEYFTN